MEQGNLQPTDLCQSPDRIDFRKIKKLIAETKQGSQEAKRELLDIYTSLKQRARLAEDLLHIVERNYRRTKDEKFKRDLEAKSGELSDEIEAFRQISKLDFIPRGDGNECQT